MEEGFQTIITKNHTHMREEFCKQNWTMAKNFPIFEVDDDSSNQSGFGCKIN